MKKEDFYDSLDWLNKYPEENYSENPSFWLRISIFSRHYEAREYAWRRLKEFSPQEIINDVETIIRLAPICRVAEQKVNELLKALPESAFEAKMKSIFSLVNEKDTFETAAIILRDLPAPLLSPYFLLIRNLLKEGCLLVTRKLMEDLLVKILNSWSLDEKRKNLQVVLEIEECGNRSLAAAAHLAHLEVIAAAPVANLQKDLDYLVRMTSYPSQRIPYLAAELAFSFFTSDDSFQGIKEVYLEYCKSFIGWGEKNLRQGFRYLALETIAKSEWIKPVNHADFLIACLDSHSRHERSIALTLLRRINPDDLPLSLLLQAQHSALARVRKHTRLLANKISSDRLLENLELLLQAQDVSDFNYRDLAIRLIWKIPKGKILEKSELLNQYSKSTNLRSNSFARMIMGLS
ncbi:MAG: hypothetical protein PHN43_01215 [Patescibacteria group bacterium]|nr:hypothetical protein [Patescibacteria group bacterium]